MEDENLLKLNRVVESPCRKWMQMSILIERYAVCGIIVFLKEPPFDMASVNQWQMS